MHERERRRQITGDTVHDVISFAAGGSYVEFGLRSSRHALTVDEGARLLGVRSGPGKTVPADIW